MEPNGRRYQKSLQLDVTFSQMNPFQTVPGDGGSKNI
jgi:hypothetical protein